MISKLDRATLAAYATAWARWRHAEAQLAKAGAVVTTPNGYAVASAYVAVANKAMALLAARAAELGLTPNGRTRVQTLADVRAKAADPIEMIFKQQQQARQSDGPH